MNVKVAFFPIAKPTFFMPSAEENYKKSCDMLDKVFNKVNKPEGLLTTPQMLEDYADTLVNPELLIYQCSTFVGSDSLVELTRRFNCPIVIWTVREPSIDGTRLKLNSLTGAFSAGNSLYNQDRKFEFVFGNPDEDEVIQKFTKLGKSIDLINKLQNLTVGMVGSQPAGFGFGNLDETELIHTFGTRVAKIEAASIMNDADSFNEDELEQELEELKSRTKGWEFVPKENLNKYARLRKAFGKFVEDNNVGALASRCWPDFFNGYGAPVCSVLSMLNDNNIPSSCEADMGGALSMFIGTNLSDEATYFGDPVAIDEDCDGIVYWHCGAGASKLARKEEGSKLGVHPNRKIGPTMEFGLKQGEVTVIRLGKCKDGFRMFIMKGEALDEPQKFYGTSVTVRPEGGNSAKRVAEFVKDGWEPHFIIVYGDVCEEVENMCKLLDIKVCKY